MDDLQLICLFVNIHGYQCSTVYTGCRKPMLIYIYIYIYIHIYLHIIIYIHIIINCICASLMIIRFFCLGLDIYVQTSFQ